MPKIAIQINNTTLVLKQNNYATKIVSAYIVNDLDNCPKLLLSNFSIKNCLFDRTTVVKNNDKEKWVYSGYAIAFGGEGSWSFGNDYARNVIFGVDTGSSSHADNRKNKFLVQGEGDTSGINGTFGAPKYKFSINFSKPKTKFCLSFHYNRYNSYLFVNWIYNFKATDNKLIIITNSY